MYWGGYYLDWLAIGIIVSMMLLLAVRVYSLVTRRPLLGLVLLQGSSYKRGQVPVQQQANRRDGLTLSQQSSPSPSKSSGRMSLSQSPSKSSRRLIRGVSDESNWAAESPMAAVRTQVAMVTAERDKLAARNDDLMSELGAKEREVQERAESWNRERGRMLGEMKKLADGRDAVILECEALKLDANWMKEVQDEASRVSDERDALAAELASKKKDMKELLNMFETEREALREKVKSRSDARKEAVAEAELLRGQLVDLERLKEAKDRAEERINYLVGDAAKAGASEKTLSELLDKERERTSQLTSQLEEEKKRSAIQLAETVAAAGERDADANGPPGQGDTKKDEEALRRINELEAELEAAIIARDQARERYEDLITNEKRLKDLLDGEKEQTSKLTDVVQQRTARLDALQTQVDELTKEKESVLLKNKAIKKSVQDKLGEIKETFAVEFAKCKEGSDERIASLSKEKNEIQGALGLLKKERDDAVAGRESMHAKVEQQAVDKMALSKQVEKLQDKVVEYQLMMTSLEEQNDKAEARLLELQGLNGDEADLYAVRAEVSELTQQRDALQQEIEMTRKYLQQAKDGASSDADSGNEPPSTSPSTIDEMSALKIAELEAQISELRSNQAALEDTISQQECDIKRLEEEKDRALKALQAGRQRRTPSFTNVNSPDPTVKDNGRGGPSKWETFQQELKGRQRQTPRNAATSKPIAEEAYSGDYGPRKAQKNRPASGRKAGDASKGVDAFGFSSPMNHYEALGVATDAGLDDIKKAYRKLALKYHPDKSNNCPDSEEKFKEVSKAYEVLSDVEAKRKYDSDNWFA
mmetsp:Transcript_36103/g.78481  ORF Transcript_36103/g.78481 Transcript_36103/m.78481 type:complete len:820 (+) Transcript_36103:1068-3527(+)